MVIEKLLRTVRLRCYPVCVMILIGLLVGCSEEGIESITPELTGAAVFCDSMGASHDDVTGWPVHLQSLITDEIWHDCRPGWTLQAYNVSQVIQDAGIAGRYKYGILALGVNDLFQGASLIDVLDLYVLTLDEIEAHGFEPVCMLYPYTTAFKYLVNPLNDGIIFICEQRDFKIVASTEMLLGDGLHPNNLGGMETAENVWRALF